MFYVILFLIPILTIVIGEILLKSFDYGNDYSTFVRISDKFEDYKFFNPKLPQKYFGNSPITPSVIPDGFKEIKDNNTIRIFALGGSSTAGYPHPPNGSFPRLLKRLLQKKYPDIDFEVINLGVSAINSITLRDIIDDVLIENPDLIILYAGHNEYYGALGPASNVSGFYNLFATRLVLNMKKFRTVQLIENLIGDIISKVSDKSELNKTLMSEMAGNNLVPLNSEEFTNGVNQFESNLNYIFSRCTEEKVTLLVGTLASNLMQPPLCRYAGCDSLFKKFNLITGNLNSNSKEKLYKIKDEDELRFRAPEKFNRIILSLAEKFNITVYDVKGMYEKVSPNGIIGNNFMLDHLHPSFEGNSLISEFLFGLEEISNLVETKSIVSENPSGITDDTLSYPSYTRLDSSYANLRIQFLKNDFPFVPERNLRFISQTINSIEDSIAKEIIDGKISWESAHLKLADIYFEKGKYDNFMTEINVLIEDKPFDKFPYVKALKSLEKIKQIEMQSYLLNKYYKIFPDLFSARRLADLYFSQLKFREAINFYHNCLKYDKRDPRIYFNLSASYYGVKDLPRALENITKCLKLDSTYPNAQKIYSRLMKIYQSRK